MRAQFTPKTRAIVARICERCGTEFPAFRSETLRHNVRFCSRSCSTAFRRDRSLSSLADRFWSKVRKSDHPNGCWEWTGGTTGPDGRGVTSINGENVYATHAAWFLHYGVWPRLDMCHGCDNPPCVRWDHLFEGSKAQNSADMVAKGRAATGERNGSRLQRDRLPRGERQWAAKLTADIVRAIREEYEASGASHAKLAARYGVTPTAIGLIVRRRTWRHIP